MLPGKFFGTPTRFFFSFARPSCLSEKSRNLSFDPEGLEQSQCQRATSHIGNLILSQKKVTNRVHNENPLLLYDPPPIIFVYSMGGSAALGSAPADAAGARDHI